MMIAVFDFPDRSNGNDADAVPELVVDYLRGYERCPSLRRDRPSKFTNEIATPLALSRVDLTRPPE